MHTITVTMTPADGNNHVSIGLWIECINSCWSEIYDFFNDCINEKLIINQCMIDADGINDKTTYFSPNHTTAQIFQNRFEEQKINFLGDKLSMKQFWQKYKFDISIATHTIDTLPTNGMLELIDYSTKEIWNTKFPLPDPYDHLGNLP